MYTFSIQRHLRIPIVIAVVFVLFFSFVSGTLPVSAATQQQKASQACSNYVISQSSDYVNNAGYSLSVFIYSDRCSDFYAVAYAGVPRGNSGGGSLCVTFADGQYCTTTGAGTDPQGNDYTVFSGTTHYSSGTATSNFTNIPGGDLHADASYFCVKNC